MEDPYKEFLESLRYRLEGSLPAHSAHQKMMSHRLPIDQLEDKIRQAKQSAVLILMYPHLEELYTVFIQRTSYKGVHSGQIAFPGGKYEESDQDLLQTALREAEEEVGVRSDSVETIGSISPLYVPPSNFLINPYVGYTSIRPTFVPEPSEVATILETPIRDLIGEHRLLDHQVEVQNGQRLNVKGFSVKEKIIWGATAMILKEFIELLEELKPPI